MKGMAPYMKVKLCILLTALTVLQCFLYLIPASAAEDPELSGSNPVLISNAESGTVLYSREADRKIYPASTVKLMTAILAIEYYKDSPDRYITITKGMLSEVSGNSIGLKANESVMARDLLNAMIVGGANDAAYALACGVAGTAAAFVEKMNAKAIELGANSTVYTNPSGMHNPGMVTTVNDTFIIAQYAYSLDMFMSICKQSVYRMPETNMTKERTIVSKNYFMSKAINADYYDSSVTGMNAGSTTEAGLCLVASLTGGDGINYIAISMNAAIETVVITPPEDILDESGAVIGQTEAVTKKDYSSYTQVKALVKWAQKNFSYRTVVNESNAICETEVRMAQGVDHIALIPERSLELYLPNDVNISDIVSTEYILYNDYMTAPVKPGDAAGILKVYYDGKITEIPLVARSTVEKSHTAYWMVIANDFIHTPKFAFICIAAAIIAVIYIAGVAVIRYRRKIAAKREFYKTHRYNGDE